MNQYQNIEYYQTCPSCGAVNTGMDRCEYCGASLIKSMTQGSSSSGMDDLESVYQREDADLPMIRGKSCSRNPFLILFCSIFGGVFLLVPTIIFCVFSAVGMMELWTFFVCLLFWVIGAGSMVPLIRYEVNRSRCKNGEQLAGTIRGYEENAIMMVNGRPVQNIKIRMMHDGSPCILLLSTMDVTRKYGLGQQVQMKRYKNHYMIVEAS